MTELEIKEIKERVEGWTEEERKEIIKHLPWAEMWLQIGVMLGEAENKQEIMEKIWSV